MELFSTVLLLGFGVLGLVLLWRKNSANGKMPPGPRGRSGSAVRMVWHRPEHISTIATMVDLQLAEKPRRDGFRVVGAQTRLHVGVHRLDDPRAQRAFISIIVIILIHRLIRELVVLEAVEISGDCSHRQQWAVDYF